MGHHEPASNQRPPDRRFRRHRRSALTAQVPVDRPRTGIDAEIVELFAQRHDGVFEFVTDALRAGLGRP